MNLVLTRGGEGVQNPENLADVICERPLRQARRRAWRVQSACGICQFYGPRQAKFANKEVHLRTLGSDMRRETPKVISMAHPNPIYIQSSFLEVNFPHMMP